MKISSVEAAAYSVPVLIKLAKKEDADKWRLRTDQADTLGWKSLLELSMKDELLAMVLFNRGQELTNDEGESLTPEQFVELARRGDWRNAQEMAATIALEMMAVDGYTLAEIVVASEDQSGVLISEVLTQMGIVMDAEGVESVRHGLIGMIEHEYDRIAKSLEDKKGI